MKPDAAKMLSSAELLNSYRLHCQSHDSICANSVRANAGVAQDVPRWLEGLLRTCSVA